MNALARAGAALLGRPLARTVPLQGGSLSQIVRIVLADGGEAIVKNGPAPRSEAAMLEAIRAAGAPAPAVLGADDTVLVIEALPADGTLAQAWADLGRQTATLHRTEADSYGWDVDYAFGPMPIENARCADWPAFWAERRLLAPLPHLPGDLARRVERLAADLPNRLPRHPRAALLHGDLWDGNVLSAAGRITGLIDPACYHGHAEVDLAMLATFNRPSQAFRDAYGTPEPGHAQRAPIYGLWPALVHLRLFGGGYRSMVEQRLSEAGA